MTIADKNKVKRVKLSTNPTTIPMGRLCPPFRDPERTIGRIGRMQGESIVIKPAMNEKSIRRST